MKITDVLMLDNIQLDVPASSKKQVLETIAKFAASSANCEQQIIFDALVERERLGTTGIGKGVAIPHARLAELSKLYCLFMRVKPVDFESDNLNFNQKTGELNLIFEFMEKDAKGNFVHN